MTKPIGGEVIEPYANPELLAPGTVRRPEWIRPEDWARMPWPAQWRAARPKQHAMDTHARRFQLRMRAGLCRWRPTGDSGWALEDDDVGRVVAVYPAPLEGPA